MATVGVRGLSVCVCAVIEFLSRNMTEMQLSQQQQRQQMSAGMFEMSAANSRPSSYAAVQVTPNHTCSADRMGHFDLAFCSAFRWAKPKAEC